VRGRSELLNISNIIAAAQNTGAEAIHPGYGFLAENAYFAELCETNGSSLLGPNPR
jgi:acetyl-CoA carboxylase biotin carboxylase subunit